MFNKKLLNVLAYTLAVLVLVKFGLDLLLFVWTFWVVPGWIQNQTVGKVLNLLTSAGGVIFIYVVVGALRNICLGTGAPQSPRAPMPPRPPMPFVRRPAPIHHHPVKK